MGVTSFDIPKLEKILRDYHTSTVMELGAQNRYDQPSLPAPYMRAWYDQHSVSYDSIDLSGEDGAWELDLAKDLGPVLTAEGVPFYHDLVTDFGTSEHVGINGKFSWEAIYNCWKNKHNLLVVDGIMFSENPKTGNWPGHGFNYYSLAFYYGFCAITDYHILEVGEHAAMGNTTDGWNIYCIMQKRSEKFPTFEEFQNLDIQQK